MRKIIYIGRAGCTSCAKLRRDVIEPLRQLYPDNVSVHSGFDPKIQEVNNRHEIKRIPLIVVEKDGVEEFRYSGFVPLYTLEDIILSTKETLTLEEVIPNESEA